MNRTAVLVLVLVVLVAGVIVWRNLDELTAEVTGNVTLDGEVLSVAENQRARVVFRPVDGGPTAIGTIGKDGKFQLSTGSRIGVIPGDYMVGVRLVDIIPDEGKLPAPSGRPATPAIYADPLSSGLKFSIERGKNEVEIKLDSNAGPVAVELPEPVEDEDDIDDETRADDTDADGDEPVDDTDAEDDDSDEDESDATVEDADSTEADSTEVVEEEQP